MRSTRERLSRLRAGARACLVASAAIITVVATGCGVSIPADPDGTLDGLRGGTLRAGASIGEPLVQELPDGSPAGPLVDLVDDFAVQEDAAVEWTIGSEETLVTMLEEGTLDIVVGGMTDQTPWSDRAAITRGYPEIEDTGGRSIVMLVPLGENELLSTLEAFLDRRVGS